MSGQSVVDRLNAAKHSLAGQGLAKAVCKATTEEVMGPKRKHLDYLLQCTNEPNVSTPQMADLLIERTQSSNWIVVFKALITIHNIMNYGNEKFFQYLASNNCAVSLESFLDKSHVQGFDMSTYIRKYGKYINEKVVSYRALAYDLCKVKKGKEDGLLRTMPADKTLKALTALQSQVDALLEFDATPSDLVNSVISAAFLLVCKDLIRLFACYNDGIINLLEKYFGLNRKQCREALDIYKQFLLRMDKISAFLKGAEPWAKKQNAGIDKDEIPDLAKAPASLLETLEAHLATLEAKRKKSKPPKAAAASAATDAPVNGSTVADSADGQAQSQQPKQQQQLAVKDGAPASPSAGAAVKPSASPKVDRPAKPKAKKKSSSKGGSSAKEAKKDSVDPPAVPAAASEVQPSPKHHAAPPRPPPVSKTPQTLSPLHSAAAASGEAASAASAAADPSSQLLLLLEPEPATAAIKPSNDLLELSVDSGHPSDVGGSFGGDGAALLPLQASEPGRPAAAAASKMAPEVGIVGKADGALKPTARSASPARPSSNVDLLSALGDPLESVPSSSIAMLDAAIGTPAVADTATTQQLDILAKLSLKPTPTKSATTNLQATGIFLLDFDTSQAGSSALDIVAERKTAAPSSSSSSAAAASQGASAFTLDLLGSPLDAGSALAVAEGSGQAAAAAAPAAAIAAARAQPAAVALVRGASAPPATAAAGADVTAGSAGDLLELLMAPVAPAAAACAVVDDPLGVNLLAPTAAAATSAATTTVKEAEIDLLSLEPELDELDSESLLRSLDPLKSSSAASLAAEPRSGELEKLVAAAILSPAPTTTAAALQQQAAPADVAKSQQSALNQAAAAHDSPGRPFPPPYSPRDPIEMAMMKNMNFSSISPTKTPLAAKQPLSSISKPPTDITKTAANVMAPTIVGASLAGTAAAAKNHPASTGYDSHKVTGAITEPVQPRNAAAALQEKPIIGSDLDTSLISLASNLTSSTGTQRHKSPFQWHPAADKKQTGGGSAAGDSASSARQPLSSVHAAGASTVVRSMGVIDQPVSAGSAKMQPQPNTSNVSQIAKQPSTAKAAAPAVPTSERNTDQSLDPFGSL